MSKAITFRPWNPEQTLLLPPSPVEWLPENHLVFFLLDLAVNPSNCCSSDWLLLTFNGKALPNRPTRPLSRGP
jgi:hypothetical protein